ncbi:hypothetical protein BH18ACT15_BH18ACT15_15250 [soil metagenome]
MVAALGVVTALAMTGAIVVSNRPAGDTSSNTDKVALETYTSSLQSLLEQLGPTGEAMASAPLTITKETDARKLAADARGWEAKIVRAEAQAATAQPGPQVVASYQVVTQATHLFLTAAKTYQLAPDVETGAQGDLLRRAGEQRDQANLLWQTGVGLLDQERAKAGLGPSGLQSPVPAPASSPSAPAGSQSPSGKPKGDKNG